MLSEDAGNRETGDGSLSPRPTDKKGEVIQEAGERVYWRDSHERIYKKQLEVSAFCFKQWIDRRILYRIIYTGNVFTGDAAAITGTGDDH